MKVNNKNKRGRRGSLASPDTLMLQQYFLSGGSRLMGAVWVSNLQFSEDNQLIILS